MESGRRELDDHEINLLGLDLSAGCSSESYYLSGDSQSEQDYDEAAPSSYADTGTMDAAAEWEDDYEPEDENAFTRLQPAAVPEYVFVANPDRNTFHALTYKRCQYSPPKSANCPQSCSPLQTKPRLGVEKQR